VILRHGYPVRSLVALADGRLASGGEDGDIKIWPRDGVGEPVTLRHGYPVLSLLLLADGRLASAGTDGQIKLWPRDGMGEPVILPHGNQVRSLVVLADGRLASAGDDGNVKLWLVDQEKLIASLCLRAGRNLTKAEWVRYIGFDDDWQPSCRNLPSKWRTPKP
jgi:WD40 repeat protein